jgi:hypothetical protein
MIHSIKFFFFFFFSPPMYLCSFILKLAVGHYCEEMIINNPLRLM